MIWLAYLAFVIWNAAFGRKLVSLSVFQRLNDFHWQVLVTLDIAVALIIFWPPYILGLLKQRPLPWATISTICGANSLAGHRWAMLGEAVIDTIFATLTGQKFHCLNSYLAWKAPLG